MIDLVYKLGSKPEGEDYSELRYSIRSAFRHFKDIGHIFIIGMKPRWLDTSNYATYIPLDDPYTHNKDANLINKLIIACNEKKVSEKFLNMSDDMFFLKDLKREFFETAYYNNKVIETFEAKKKIGGRLTRWELRLERTLNVLKSKSLQANCYETHMPVMIDKNSYMRILLNYDYGEGNGMCGNTIYFNNVEEIVKIHLLEELLCRVEQKILDMNELQLQVKPNYLLNYTVNSYNEVIDQFLRARFNEPSKVELF